MVKRISSDRIYSLKDNEVFVFGSNESGRHGKGTAKLALDNFGAIYGQSFGLQGNSFAIPTKDKYIKNTLPINKIKEYVDEFIIFAKDNSELNFLVTEIGCGLAGLTPNDIAPLFKECIEIENIYLPKRFINVLLGLKDIFD